jgi:hypothetical protein
MIRKAKLSNFYSFKGEQEINFLAKKKKSYSYYNSKTEDQVTKIAGFIGGNASGKTNIMRFFSFLSYFVCESSRVQPTPNLNIAFKTFFNNKKPSNFGIEFEIADNIFYYNASIKNHTILKEALYTKKIKKAAKKIKIFLREKDDIQELNKEYFKGFSLKFLKNIRSDVSLIAFLKAHYNIDIVNIIYNYFLGFKTNINETGEINNPHHQLETLYMYLQDEKLKEAMEDFISRFDIGLSGFLIEKKKIDNKLSIRVQGVHNTGEENNKINLKYESRGTQSLFFTLAKILTALKHNNILILDEIEAGFHPEALNKLISYFIDEARDKKTQLVFSSHSLSFINKLDMHQLFLVEKDSNSESCAYRLNQVEGIRSDENFLAKYMAGAYGAFPQIRV